MYSRTRVALPTPRTRRPVASGSRVPAWPTLRSCSSRRTTSTISCEVFPWGLSTSRIPSMLYVLATPIGNLEDLSARALAILREADVIVSEDTRTTHKLLSRYDIQKPMIAYFQHSPPRRLEEILQRLTSGQKVALVTESGTPAVSDPGARLVD